MLLAGLLVDRPWNIASSKTASRRWRTRRPVSGYLAATSASAASSSGAVIWSMGACHSFLGTWRASEPIPSREWTGVRDGSIVDS